jgi:hypothetical protein
LFHFILAPSTSEFLPLLILWATNFGKRKKKKKEAFNENNLIIAKMVKGIITIILGRFTCRKKLSFTIFDLYPLHATYNVQVNLIGIFGNL